MEDIHELCIHCAHYNKVTRYKLIESKETDMYGVPRRTYEMPYDAHGCDIDFSPRELENLIPYCAFFEDRDYGLCTNCKHFVKNECHGGIHVDKDKMKFEHSKTIECNGYQKDECKSHPTYMYLDGDVARRSEEDC